MLPLWPWILLLIAMLIIVVLFKLNKKFGHAE
jgi:hypothetical protein